MPLRLPGARSAHGPTLLAIRRARRRRLADIAQAAGLSTGYLSKLERSVHTAGESATGDLAAALDVPAEVLTGQVPAIRALRRILGVSESDVAATAGMPSERLARIERGTERPHADELALIARRLGVDVAALDGDAQQTEPVA